MRLYPVQKFCQSNCRKEFHKNGGNAFGPLKIRLEKLVQVMVRSIVGEMERRLSGLERIAEKLYGTANAPDAGASQIAGGKQKSGSWN
jgi:hypothetical protein